MSMAGRRRWLLGVVTALLLLTLFTVAVVTQVRARRNRYHLVCCP